MKAIKKGDSVIFKINVKDKNGNIINLTDSTFAYSFAKNSFSTTTLFSKDLDSGISIIDATKGILQISILSTDLDIEPGIYYHECKMTKNSQKRTIFSGKVVIENSLIG